MILDYTWYIYLYVGYTIFPNLAKFLQVSSPSYMSSCHMFISSLYWLLFHIVLDYYVTSQDVYFLYCTFICSYLEYVSFLKLNLSTFFVASTFMYTLSLILLCEYVDIKYSSNLLAESYMSSLCMCFHLRCQKFVQSHRRSIMLVSHLLPTSLSLSLVHIRMSSTTVS